MTETDVSVEKIIKIAGVLSLSLGINYLITHMLKSNDQDHHHNQYLIKQSNNQSTQQNFLKLEKRYVKQQQFNFSQHALKLQDFNQEDQEDGLLDQLTYRKRALFNLKRVNNLILDLPLKEINTIRCPLISSKKHFQGQSFLQKEEIIKSGEFLIKNCVFKYGQQIQSQKKYMKAGPRNTQFFNPKDVKADIVCLGKLCPGINNIIRQLVFMLKTVYKVPKVFGVKYSFQGYYSNNVNQQKEFIVELNPDMIETIHHKGGCFLQMSKTQFRPNQIVDNLVKRRVNQMYLIGGYSTFVSAHYIYREIKKRKLAIGICVLLKAINKDVAIFDSCFGFQSALQQCQKIIQIAYINAKSYKNTVCLIKVPGKYSGFLAADATNAARNVDICLVPQFPFDFYGQSGLLRYISGRIKHQGSCLIVYSQGACHSARDIDMPDKQNWENFNTYFDRFLKDSITEELNKLHLSSNNVMFFESTERVGSVPANSLDTKLCCQVAHSSIYGMMCGYTNFVCGHLGMRNAMVPITQMMSRQNLYCLKPEHQAWQRTLATTNQPSFINI